MTNSIRIAEMIRRSVDLWYADIVTFKRFSARQATLWALAVKFGVDDEVMEIVKPRLRKAF